MALESEEVRRIAQLAHLEYPEGERLWSEEALLKMAKDIDAVVQHVAELQNLDLSEVPKTSHAVPLSPHLRQDAPSDGLCTELALREAPASEEGAFVVPKVIE